jgi:hypothetical protein
VATQRWLVAWVVVVVLAQWQAARLEQEALALWAAQERPQLINLAIWQVSLRLLLHRL